MIYNSIKDFINTVPQETRLVALDVGTKTIGIAVCDKDRNITTPKTTIRRRGNQKDIPQLLKLLDEYKVGGIVVGLPLNAKEKETEISLFIRRFAENLSQNTDLSICFFDERLSSAMAEEFMIETMGTKYQKTKKLIDKTSASFILRAFLDEVSRKI